MERGRERGREGERDEATHHFGSGDFASHKLDKRARRGARCNVVFAEPQLGEGDEDILERRSIELHLLGSSKMLGGASQIVSTIRVICNGT